MRSLKRYPERLKLYTEAMEEMLKNQEIEKVSESPSVSKSIPSVLYCIPHSGVYKKERERESLLH